MVAVAEHESVGARLQQPGEAVGDSLGRLSEITLAALVGRDGDPRHDPPVHTRRAAATSSGRWAARTPGAP